MTTPSRTRIKVCGITNPQDAQAAIDAGADALGFIFVEDSPRYITPEDAAQIMFNLPPFIAAVGVTKDLDIDKFCRLEHLCPTQTFQLHGKEPIQLVQQCGPGVIKAFKYEAITIKSQLDRWAKIMEVDALLIDGSDGGEGKSFNWPDLAPHLENYPKDIIIAGGLDETNVAQAIQTLNPYAIDVSSGVESEPGKKDHQKLHAFCKAVRNANN